MVQWLGLHAFTAKGLGSIPGWGTKFLQVSRWGQEKTKHTHTFLGVKILFQIFNWLRCSIRFCWWLSSKGSACQRRRHGFNAWSRKIPPAEGQLRPLHLSLCAIEPTCCSFWSPRVPEPVPQDQRSRCHGRHMHCSWRAAPAHCN